MGPDEALEKIGQRIKFLREHRLRVSQRDLVEDLKRGGVVIDSHTTLGRIERGMGQPGADLVAVLARLARVSPVWLLTGDGEMIHRPPELSEQVLQVVAGIVHAVERDDDPATVQRILTTMAMLIEGRDDGDGPDEGSAGPPG